MRRVHALLTGWMQAAGMQVRVDAAGNLRGGLPAADPNAPRLLIGSHLDTIPNAGAYDGILGVVLGVALVEEAGKSLPFALEVIGFSEEEGVRFSKPFLGSLAFVGDLDEKTLARTDRNGVSVAQAIREFGLDSADLAAAVLDPSTFAYLEFHIEQGPVLESEDLALAVVDAIAGQTRMQATFTGHANHAGTTPMHLRRDSLAAAAAVDRRGRALRQRHCPGLVATVGKIDVPSAAANVIPGGCTAALDVRHAQDSVRAAAVQHYLDYAHEGRSGSRALPPLTPLRSIRPPCPWILLWLRYSRKQAPAPPAPRPQDDQRRRPRRHDPRPPRARRHALPALARRHQPSSRRGGPACGCCRRTRRRSGVPAHLAR